MAVQAGNVVVIVNKDSSQTHKKRKTLDKLLKKHGVKAEFVDGPDTDAAVRRALEKKGLKRLVIAGGDGSVRVAASLISRLRPSVTLGIIPVGTANYYAKSLGVHRSLEKAFETALGDQTEARHLTRANGRDFLLGLNIGYTSYMFNEVTKEEKKRFGRVAYVRGIFRVLRKLSPPKITISVEGRAETYSTSELVILNQHIGGRVPLVPKVKGTEPYFEIVTYGLGDSKLAPLFAASIFILTFGHNQKYLKRIKATKASISSRTPQPVSIDGDTLDETPLTVELIEQPVYFAYSKSVK